MIKLKKLLLETPEANPDDIFGEYIFGKDRKDVPAKLEKNTDDENFFTDSLKKHYAGSIYNSSLSFYMPTLIELIKSGKYLNFLNPDDKFEYAYRLMFGLSIHRASEICNVDFASLLENSTTFGVIDKSFTYTPKISQMDMSSWTVSKNREIFKHIINQKTFLKKLPGTTNVNNSLVTIFMKAKIKDNIFVLNPEEISNKTNLEEFKELETLSFGDVKIESYSFFILDPDNTSGFGQTKLLSMDSAKDNYMVYDYKKILNKLIEIL
jgi:hypothetical protein